MSLPLKDLRTAIDERTHIVLSAAAAAQKEQDVTTPLRRLRSTGATASE